MLPRQLTFIDSQRDVENITIFILCRVQRKILSKVCNKFPCIQIGGIFQCPVYLWLIQCVPYRPCLKHLSLFRLHKYVDKQPLVFFYLHKFIQHSEMHFNHTAFHLNHTINRTVIYYLPNNNGLLKDNK